MAFQCRVVFRTTHAAGLLRGRLKDRQAHLLTDHVIAPHQLLQLLFRHVQLFASFEVDGVDDAVGVDVLPVYVGTDQHLTAVEVFASRRAASWACRGSTAVPFGKLCTMW